MTFPKRDRFSTGWGAAGAKVDTVGPGLSHCCVPMPQNVVETVVVLPVALSWTAQRGRCAATGGRCVVGVGGILPRWGAGP